MGIRAFTHYPLRLDWHYPHFLKEVVEMEEKDEASASMWVWVIIIAIAAALIAGFVIFLKP